MYIEGEREAKIQALFVFVMPHTLTHLHGTYIHHRTARGGRKNYHHPGADEARGYVPGNQRKGSALRYSEWRLNV